MKVLVTGARGQLGSDVVARCRLEGLEVIEHDRAEGNITDEIAIKDFIRNSGVDAVIHCAAYTAVDKAEDESELCFNINVNGTKYIAEACLERGIKMLYISTDYIFDGSGEEPWKVDDEADPVNYYGRTKYLGELEVLGKVSRVFIVRISWVFGENGNNFVKTMLKLATSADPATGVLRESINVVDDQVGSPTYTYDLAKLLCEMIQTEKYGVYHATNEGTCSWYEFACEIFKQAGIDIKVKPIKSADYKTRAARPLNSRLDKSKLGENGFERLRGWKEAVGGYLGKIVISIKS